MARPRILFLDAYDSFTNNIASLLTTTLDADVKVLRIDDSRLDPSSHGFDNDWREELRHFDALVCGPGPGSPACEADVGLMKRVWDRQDEVIPVLGICLGFQSLLCHFGAGIRQLKGGLHGMIRKIECPQGETGEGDIFAGVQPFKATLYHSLCVDIGQDSIPPGEWPDRKWRPLSRCPAIIPLAWTEEVRSVGVERILMAAKHRDLPFWGLQYHPESVCTDAAGKKVIENWFREALRWNREHGRTTDAGEPLAHFSVTPSHLSSTAKKRRDTNATAASHGMDPGSRLSNYGLGCTLAWETIGLPRHVTVPDLVEVLSDTDDDQIILDSSNHDIHLPKSAVDVRGRYSVIALDVQHALQLRYRAGDNHIAASIPKKGISEHILLGARNESFWQFASGFFRRRRISPPEGYSSPFLGGFMGYVSYEMGLHDLDIPLSESRSTSRPDVSWVWVTRSLVIDHVKSVVHIQQLCPAENSAKSWRDSLLLERQEGEQWINSILCRLRSSTVWSPSPTNGVNPSTNGRPVLDAVASRSSHDNLLINLPSKKGYMAKVRRCQEYIAEGESYELCLTNKAHITLLKLNSAQNPNGPTTSASETNGQSRDVTPWHLYRSLRKRQPAPFGSYLRLGPTTFLSSSPERFLSCSREGVCFMHPMKGTAKKSESVATLADAEKLLRVPKEEAENLMIVDLVRHDLHSVCGPGNVEVPKLMQIEEYASVFQMITVVKGTLPQTSEVGEEYTALDALAGSLPPGSMTGAPKKRSCEILRGIEGYKERGVYSGVTGYMDVSGRADWSVNIRCLFRYDDECAPGCERGCMGRCEAGETWHVGAGGAVTTLSTPEGECEEMFAKLEGSLGLFGVRD